jgi:hypothetical protein
MPNRYTWIQRRPRQAAGSSTDLSPNPDLLSPSQTPLNNSAINADATGALDLSAALVPPSQGELNDDIPYARQESSSPTYLTTSNRSSFNSQKSPSFSKHRRRFGDEDEDGSSMYFISEPSLSEDCRSLENSTSPTHDLYMTHPDDGGSMFRPYFSPMQLVHRKSSRLEESPDESANDSLQDSTDELVPTRLKLHTIHSSIFEGGNSSSDDELDSLALHDQPLSRSDIPLDTPRSLDAMGSSHITMDMKNNPIDGHDIHQSLDVSNQVNQMDSNQLKKQSGKNVDRRNGKLQRWSFTKGETADNFKILRPAALRMEQNPSNEVTGQTLTHFHRDVTQDHNESLISSIPSTKENQDDLSRNQSHQVMARTMPDSDSTSSISSPDSACSRSSSPFSWISGKKTMNKPEESMDDVAVVMTDTYKNHDNKRIPLTKDIHDEKRSLISRQSTVGRMSMFGTGVSDNEAKKFPTFVCPGCNTRQREFFTVATVPGQFESPAGYLAIYFGIYVIASLYIFGLEVNTFILVSEKNFRYIGIFTSLCPHFNRRVGLLWIVSIFQLLPLLLQA